MNPEEVQAAFEAFALLEPEIQKGIAALISHFQHKPDARTAEDFIAAARQYMKDQQTP